jgi:hypothetical protein
LVGIGRLLHHQPRPGSPPGALISWRPSLNTWQVFFYNPSPNFTIRAQTIAYRAPTS